MFSRALCFFYTKCCESVREGQRRQRVMGDSSLCSGGGYKRNWAAWLFVPTELAPGPGDNVLGHARCFLQKCTVTHFSFRSKSKKILQCPVPSLCTAAQSHTRLCASAPLYRTGRRSSGVKRCTRFLRVSLPLSPFDLPPFCCVLSTDPGLEPHMGQAATQKGTDPSNGGRVGGTPGILTPQSHRLQAALRLCEPCAPSQESRGREKSIFGTNSMGHARRHSCRESGFTASGRGPRTGSHMGHAHGTIWHLLYA